ncbi:hypothetical protein D3D02_13235 [Halobellus sp. Atlit-38R]|uniref:hypothetical protein n=1 Tax=Halobellus sp. Atlit-38R TaxID=2282131 RepID=UPI000EF1DD6E|nr:hypothetical protein [Halobellus sp. Atlit-38R]RLM88169.1 hypothetical protein D3D02_13235 [Halobellus sp. Atlit-38R]
MSRSERVVGAAENVDLREADDVTPFDRDVDDRRVISAYCCTCGKSTTILAESGRTRRWEHDELNASHVVDYWRED